MTAVDAIKQAANAGRDKLPALEQHALAAGAKKEDWAALVAGEKDAYNSQNDALKLAIERLEALEKRKKQATDRQSAAKAKSAELRSAIQKQKEQQATESSKAATVADYASFIKERGRLHHEVIQRLAVWKKAAGYSADALRNAPLEAVFQYLDSWPSFDEQTVVAIGKLKQTAAIFHDVGADVADVDELDKDFRELRAVYDADASKLLREQARRQDYNQNVEKLLNNQAQLLHWCRQQRAALDGQKEPDHIQEFCASLQNNIGVMETNFLVIMEMAEHLVPNPSVEKALIEVAEVWMALEVFAYEKLRATLVDLHQKSGLESECKLWAEYSLRFKKFLEAAEHLLEMPTDAESKAVTKPVLEDCKQLLADHDLHLIIAEHLSDFSLREECVKDHYSAIRTTIFSKLTLLTQSFVGHQGYARKTEYTDRLAELSDWIECKSQNGAWKDLLGRIEKMRKMVEANEITTAELSSTGSHGAE